MMEMEQNTPKKTRPVTFQVKARVFNSCLNIPNSKIDERIEDYSVLLTLIMRSYKEETQNDLQFEKLPYLPTYEEIHENYNILGEIKRHKNIV